MIFGTTKISGAIKQTIFVLLLFCVSIVQGQNSLARIEYMEAETAYGNKAYDEAILHLNKAVELLGSTNPKIIYLEIQIRNSKIKPVLAADSSFYQVLFNNPGSVKDMIILDSLANLYVETYENQVPLEKLREVYTIYNRIKPFKLANGKKSFQEAIAFLIHKDMQNATLKLENSCVSGNELACSIRNKVFLPVQHLTENMVFVSGGNFYMGTKDYFYDNDEKRVHLVYLSDYYIGRYEVTVAEYKAFCIMTGREMPEMSPDWIWYNDNPIEGILWEDAVDFCKWLSDYTGKSFRLPTEAEWEFAARGGTQSLGYLYSGSYNPDTAGWHNKNSESKSQPIGTKIPNELGLYDMSGNVYELCSDYYSNKYDKKTQYNPQGPEYGPGRVARGGCYYEYYRKTSVYNRAFLPVNERRYAYGFRIVQEP